MTPADQIKRDLDERAARGLLKYGVALEDAGLEPAALVRHAYEEALDLACYLRVLLDRMER